MKRYIKSDRRLSPKKENVRRVCEYMGWSTPTFADPGANGYKIKWGGRSFVYHTNNSREEAQELVDKINEALNLDCYLTREGNLVIPYA